MLMCYFILKKNVSHKVHLTPFTEFVICDYFIREIKFKGNFGFTSFCFYNSETIALLNWSRVYMLVFVFWHYATSLLNDVRRNTL